MALVARAVALLWVLCVVGCACEMLVPCPALSNGSSTPINASDAVIVIDNASVWNSADGVVALRGCRPSSQGGLATPLIVVIRRGNMTLVVSNSTFLQLRVERAVDDRSNVTVHAQGVVGPPLNLTIVVSDCRWEDPVGGAQSPYGYPTNASFITVDKGMSVRRFVLRVVRVHVSTSTVGGFLWIQDAFTALQDVHIDVCDSWMVFKNNYSSGILRMGGVWMSGLSVRVDNTTMQRVASAMGDDHTSIVRVVVNVAALADHRFDGNANVNVSVRGCTMLVELFNVLQQGVRVDMMSSLLLIGTNWAPRINGPERLTNLSIDVKDTLVNLSGVRAKVLDFVAGMFTAGNLTLRNVTTYLNSVGQVPSGAAIRETAILSASVTVNAIAHSSISVSDATVVARLRFGGDPTVTNDLASVYPSVVSLKAQHVFVHIALRNVQHRVVAVDADTSAFAVIFTKVVTNNVLIGDTSDHLSIAVANATLSLDFPYYCPGERKSIDGPAYVLTSNAGTLSVYAAVAAMTSCNASHIDVVVTACSVHIKHYPLRQVCPQSRARSTATTMQFPPFPGDVPLDLPFLITVTVSMFALQGVDSLIDRILAELPISLPENATGQVTKFQMFIKDITVHIEQPSTQVDLWQPPIQYTSTTQVPASTPSAPTLMPSGGKFAYPADTVLSTSLLSINGVNSIERLQLQATLPNQQDAIANVTVLVVDNVKRMDDLRMVITQAAAVSSQEVPPLMAAAEGIGLGNIIGVQAHQPLLVRKPLLAINYTNVTNLTILFRNMSVQLDATTLDPHGTFPPPVLFFNHMAFLSDATIGIEHTTIRGFHRLVDGTEYEFADSSTALQLSVGCIDWNGAPLSKSQLSNDVRIFHRTVIADGCPPLLLSDTPTLSATAQKPAPRGPPLAMEWGATVIAATGIATGGLVSTAAVMSMQRSMALLRLSKCDGVDGMHDALDVFTNPVRLTVGDGLHDDDDDPQGEDDDDEAVAYGAAYRGAIVGNVCVLWGGGVVLALCGTAVLRWKQGPLWRVRESAAVLRLPGNLYPLLGAPLLQPILSCGLALLLHGRGGADWALGVLGVVAGLAVVCGACAVVSRRWFRAASTRAPYVRETRLALQAVCRERGGGVVRRARRAVESAWLRVALLLFVAEREWVPRGGRDRLFVSSLGGVFEALRDRREWGVAVEMVAVVATSVTAAVLPEGEAACRGVASADAAVNVLLVLFYVLLRPYETRYDHLTAVATAVMTSVLAVMVAAGSDDDDAEAAAEAVNILSSIILLVGVGQCATGTFLLRRRFADLWRLLGWFQGHVEWSRSVVERRVNDGRTWAGARGRSHYRGDEDTSARLVGVKNLNKQQPHYETDRQSNLSLLIAMICETKQIGTKDCGCEGRVIA